MVSQRVLLLCGAIFILFLIVHAVRKRMILIEDSLFWLCFSGLLVLLGIFPQVVFFFSHLLHFESPANMVFATAIAILLIKEFRSSSKISLLKDRVNHLAGEVALREKEIQDLMAEKSSSSCDE